MYLPNLDAWTIIAWSIATVWIVIITVFARASQTQAVLRPMGDQEPATDLPSLSVVVAARNELGCIETCIRSLFRQDYPGLEVVAVNDRSTDGTDQILDRLALEFAGRLKVCHVESLPSGWFGKPHALTLGLQKASGSLICFTDADCEFQASSALRTTVVELIRRDLDFFSIAARYSMTSLRECLAVPCCSEVLLSWLRPERIEDPRWPDAFANGAFILVKKEPFERIGGWGAVRAKVSEDLALARLSKQMGLHAAIAQAEGFYQTSSYGSLRDSWNGWSRIFMGALTPSQLLLTVVRMLVLFVLPLTAVLCGVVNGLATGDFSWLIQGAGLGFVIALGLRTMLDAAIFRLVGAPIVAAFLAPVGRLFAMAAATRALLSHAGLVHTHWRGASFSAGRLVITRQAKPGHQIP